METELGVDCREADEDDDASSDLSLASTGLPLFSPCSRLLTDAGRECGGGGGDGGELGEEGGGPSKLRLANDDKGRLPTSL